MNPNSERRRALQSREPSVVGEIPAMGSADDKTTKILLSKLKKDFKSKLVEVFLAAEILLHKL